MKKNDFDCLLNAVSQTSFVVLNSENVKMANVQVFYNNKLLGKTSKEAIRLVKRMPKWKPAEMSGKPIRFYYNLPVAFIHS